MKAGRRDTLVIFTRAGPETDDGHATIPGAPTEYARALCEVRYGKGEERRQAAQESASQAATFITEWAPELLALTPQDKLTVDGDAAEWDIAGVAPIEKSAIEITATRSA